MGRVFDCKLKGCEFKLSPHTGDCFDIEAIFFTLISDETLKAAGPFFLVCMPGEIKDPTQGVNV